MNSAFSSLYSICVYLFLFVQVHAWAQDPHPAFKHYAVEDGLPSSKVYQVKQDSKGYMWFATNNGISRFNGYEFENFSMADGLTDNTVFEIFEDKKGRIWFLSLANELSYYENEKIYPYAYNDSIRKYVAGQHVKTSFCVDEKGTVFIGFFRLGICEISALGKVKALLPQDQPVMQTVEIIEPIEKIFIYANSGLSLYNRFNFKTRLFSGLIDIDKGAEITRVTRMVRLKNRSIALSLKDRLYFVDTSGNCTTKKFPYRINWIYEGRGNILWIGTHLGGVFRIDDMNIEKSVCYLSGLSITGVLEDKEGGFWFATEGNGVYYTPSIKLLTYDKASGFGDERVDCVAADKEQVYMGLQNGEIHAVSPNGKISQVHYNAFQKDVWNILSIFYEAQKDRMWFSMADIRNGQGFSEIIKDGVTVKRINGNFRKLLPAEDNVYWAGASNGVYRITDYRPDISLLKDGHGIKRINALLYKTKEVMYVGTLNGLWKYNTLSDSCTYLGNKNTLFKNRVMDLAYAPDSTLIVATKGAGLLFHNSEGTKQINTGSGLSSNTVFKIVVDDSVIWAATDKGLSRIQHVGTSRQHIKVFDTFDGLVSNEISDIVQFKGKMWIASDRGLSFFDVGLKEDSYDSIPLYIKTVLVNDSLFEIRNNYNLKYLENNIKIEFIALSYKNSKKIRYRYRMEGLDTSWIYTQNRDIQYTTLPPGNYKFRVAALNTNGTWSRNAEIEFVISTPFWKTWWFLGFIIVVSGGVVFYVSRYWIIKKHDQRNKEAEVNRLLVQLKLKALRAQMNPHFIFNVMSSIQHFIVFKNNDAAHHYLSKFSKLIRTILNNSERNTIPLSEEMKALTLYLDLENMRLEKQFDYEIKVDESLDMNRTEIPSMLIQPYVENAVKHGILPSKQAGKITITIAQNGEFLKCTIEDNGVGRTFTANHKSSEYRSFGTAITKERLAVINELYYNRLSEQVTDLYNEEKIAQGTKVEIYIPFNLN